MESIELTVRTGDEPAVVDITGEGAQFCRDRGDGLVSGFVPHATAGGAIIETGAGSDADLLGAGGAGKGWRGGRGGGAGAGMCGARSGGGGDEPLALRLAAVEAAEVVFRITHQLHGAIGFCDETTLSWLSRASQALRRLPLGPSATRSALTDRIGRRGLTGLFS